MPKRKKPINFNRMPKKKPVMPIKTGVLESFKAQKTDTGNDPNVVIQKYPDIRELNKNRELAPLSESLNKITKHFKIISLKIIEQRTRIIVKRVT